MKQLIPVLLVCSFMFQPVAVYGDNEWEITAESEQSVRRGLEWLARNQGGAGNWQSNDLGLVALGALAFLSAGHAPDRGPYGSNMCRALDFLIVNVKPSGLLNISADGRDMYNHGLAVFVLTQAYGLSNDRRLSRVLDRGIKLICDVQCEDGGWGYQAKRTSRGHDLSLAVMQAKALRGATDIGLDIQPEVVDLAIQSVQKHYKPLGEPDGKRYGNHPLAGRPGSFTYAGHKVTTAMAAAGAVCLQEFGKYGDFRIMRSMDVVESTIKDKTADGANRMPFDAYTLYYVGQGLYQVGGERWKRSYPPLRDAVVRSQRVTGSPQEQGSWDGGRVGGIPGKLFGTAVSVFVLSIPNRYLPILQEGRVDELSGTQ